MPSRVLVNNHALKIQKLGRGKVVVKALKTLAPAKLSFINEYHLPHLHPCILLTDALLDQSIG